MQFTIDGQIMYATSKNKAENNNTKIVHYIIIDKIHSMSLNTSRVITQMLTYDPCGVALSFFLLFQKKGEGKN